MLLRTRCHPPHKKKQKAKRVKPKRHVHKLYKFSLASRAPEHKAKALTDDAMHQMVLLLSDYSYCYYYHSTQQQPLSKQLEHYATNRIIHVFCLRSIYKNENRPDDGITHTFCFDIYFLSLCLSFVDRSGRSLISYRCYAFSFVLISDVGRYDLLALSASNS